MNFRLRIAAWFALSVLVLGGVLIFTAHEHLDEELRRDRWDRSHPKFSEWVIHGSYTDEEVRDILGELIQVWLWVGIPLLLASLIAGYFIASRSVRPIRRINQELAALDSRTLSRGVRLPERDRELEALVLHINELLQRLGQSYNEMAEFSARVAHELRTPLTLLRMRIESAASELPADFSEDVQEEIGRLSQLVERSLLAAKAEGGKLETQIRTVDLSVLLDDWHDGYALLAEQKPLILEWRVNRDLQCLTDPDLIRQILHNLLANALRHGTRMVRVQAGVSRSRILVRITNFRETPPAATSPFSSPGMGLRLVHSLCSAIGQPTFRTRKLPNVFSVRLVFQTPAGNQSS